MLAILKLNISLPDLSALALSIVLVLGSNKHPKKKKVKKTNQMT